jgi:hypothetical protein
LLKLFFREPSKGLSMVSYSPPASGFVMSVRYAFSHRRRSGKGLFRVMVGIANSVFAM